MKSYVLEEDALLNLLEKAHKLRALEAGGVDNWSWYGMSCRDYIERFMTENDDEDFGFEDIARKDLEKLPYL